MMKEEGSEQGGRTREQADVLVPRDVDDAEYVARYAALDDAVRGAVDDFVDAACEFLAAFPNGSVSFVDAISSERGNALRLVLVPGNDEVRFTVDRAAGVCCHCGRVEGGESG